MSDLAVTLTKSPIGNRPAARSTVEALGLRRLHQTVVVGDSESTRGMLKKVEHLVRVEAAPGSPQKPARKPCVLVTKHKAPPADTGSAVADASGKKQVTAEESAKARAKAPVKPSSAKAKATAETAVPDQKPVRTRASAKTGTSPSAASKAKPDVDKQPAPLRTRRSATTRAPKAEDTTTKEAETDAPE